MARPVHFEIGAVDSAKIIEFYTKAFGWKFDKWGDAPYWLITTGEGRGIDGGLMPRPHPDAPTINTLDVANVDEAVKAVVDGGGSVAKDKIAIPGVGWLAYCKDPEGTIFGLMQSDPAAK